jgi:hypothetical protein
MRIHLGTLRHLVACTAVSFAFVPAACAQAAQAPQLYPNFPSETPATFRVPVDGIDYVRREVMIPMRDGVKLHTVILVPKGARDAAMLMTRTPYSANALTSNASSVHLATTLYGYDNAVETILSGGYIRVLQDIRGKYGSEGDFVMNRPFHGPLNPTPVDESTDTFDTIDWLVKNVPESNGRVGILGISYDGFLSLTPLVHPHPALKAVVPMNPMVDGWRGDDWFHNGAFRQQNLTYIYEQSSTRANDLHWLQSDYDAYDTFLRAGTPGELARQRGMEQLGFWNKITAHPAYDSFWSGQAVDQVLAAQPLTVPTLLVHSLWDQEDIYGAMAVYKALKPKDTAGNLYLAMGPWHHGQEIEDAETLGPLHWGSATGLSFQKEVLAPFLAHYLQTSAPEMHVSPVTAFVSGENRWEHLQSWPSGCENGCKPQAKPLYLQADGRLSFAAPASGPAFDDYVADPAKPVLFQPRPFPHFGDENPQWQNWLVGDQRLVSSRPDVLTYQTDVLTEPLKLSGEPIAHLIASTTGTDADWVVKLIDVYPAEVPSQPEMGGYQLAVSMDILRGRYREGFAEAKPIKANTALHYRLPLPTVNHVFLPGHRIMVQVQSSWFPLYDRNPQTFVPNIFFAPKSAFEKATQQIFHAPGKASFVELPVVPAGR